MRRFVLAFVLLILPAFSFAQDNLFTPHHVAKLRVVTSAVIAPDGSQVAYILSVPLMIPKEKDGPNWSELHVVDTKGNSTPFITGPVNIENIAWTPDGKSISFLAKRDKDEHRALYVIPMRGGESRRVLGHGSDIQGYSWKSDGKQIAFLATEPAPRDRKAQQDQGYSQEIYEEDVPPMRVWIADLDSGKTRMLDLKGSASELHWNPKMDKLAVALAPTPLIDDQLMFRKVHIVDLNTGQSTVLKNPGKMGQVAWSPDGKLLALISGADKHDPKEGRLWVWDTEHENWSHLIGASEPIHIESFAWSREANVDYVAANGVRSQLGNINGLGRDTTLATQADCSAIEAVLTHLTCSNDGTAMCYVGHSPRNPPEVYYDFRKKGRLSIQAPQLLRLTDSNPWLRNMRLAKQEKVTFKARDGLELEGILVRPLDEKKGERYPLILTVHGGPEAHISDGWTTLYHSLGQVGAARGFAVFYPNYRGSTGRGVEFSMMGQKEAAGKEFDDLVDAVDHLVKMGLVDPKKVGITGGSYGGYATAWGSTYYSDRFAAGVMFVGISDCISKVGTTDIPWEMNLVHHRKWLWEDWDYFKKSSPISYTDKAKTPLLIMHGKADPRVHPSQSLELYRHLKLRGQAPVRLVLYPGEGHGNRRAASRLDYNLRLLQWMEHYLKGPGGAPPPYELDYNSYGGSKSASWRHTPMREMDRGTLVEASIPWLGRGCPCCIGW
ncbi:MAG: S9 family peptidase [Planctomycetes bacterium]|nr:S9 family peptidase [Planctomycetota bacterium]